MRVDFSPHSTYQMYVAMCNSVLENMYEIFFFFFFSIVICRLFAKRLVLFGRVSIADGVIRAS